MRNIELVFRSIGERTAELALQFAMQHIAPQRVHIIENVRPFSRAVRQMLEIDYRGDYVVFMDADCLIMEDMRPFLECNSLPYIDCYVLDKFRGRRHMGVHITRLDVVRAMQEIDPPEESMRLILNPESGLRQVALIRMAEDKAYKDFRIYHDFHQYYRHIFAKCALRELRSRVEYKQQILSSSMHNWHDDDLDFFVARQAVDYTRRAVPPGQSPAAVADFIAVLPEIAAREMERMNIPEKLPLTMSEVMLLEDTPGVRLHFQSFARKKFRVFGIGLSRTGTKSLTRALNMLGYSVVHNPDDAMTYQELVTAHYALSVLDHFDGITDITVSSFYPQLDRLYPNSKFILTVRDKASWMQSLQMQWDGKSVLEEEPGEEVKLKLRRFLRAAVYGTYTFDAERMSYVYDRHYQNVVDYFRGRPDSLLIMDITAGDGWERLCPFLDLPLLDEPFPHVTKKSTLNEPMEAVLL